MIKAMKTEIMNQVKDYFKEEISAILKEIKTQMKEKLGDILLEMITSHRQSKAKENSKKKTKQNNNEDDDTKISWKEEQEIEEMEIFDIDEEVDLCRSKIYK